jgi:hypothetical protein
MRPHKLLSIRLLVAAVLGVLALATPAGAAPGGISVTGGLILDDFGNQLSVSAHSTADGGATGELVFQSGLSGAHNFNSPQVIRIRVTCLVQLSPTVVAVGGATEGATAGVGTIFPYYTFLLEDLGPGNLDKWTAYFEVSDPCVEPFGPGGIETAVGGNIVIQSG